ncbi:MAG: fructose bisphosphate aldolase [Sphingomonas bacterium]|nr:fructose bisphosphate aldolase [Sphingomonas bacterium]
MTDPKMLAQIKDGQGFIAALDQSGGSTPGALKGYGVAEDAYSTDEQMFGLIHAMRSRIITSPCFNGDKVIGAILFEKTMDGEAGGEPVPEALWKRGVVPFLKVDKGLEDEADGVKLMKPMPDLDALLERAAAKGVFGTKMRSVIERASPIGIAAIVAQQFAVAEQISTHDLMPMIEPEVSIKSPDRDAADRMLLAELVEALDALPEDRQVILKLTLPAEANLYAPLVDHPRVLRVVALSGGFSRDEACRQLAQNRGMIASFSRALLSDLRSQMSDDEFSHSLGTAIDEIHSASIA